MNTAPNNLLLNCQNIKIYFPIKTSLFSQEKKYVKAVDDLSFKIFSQQRLGIVGESGSGKSTLANALTGTLPLHAGRIHYTSNSLDFKIEKEAIANWKLFRKEVQLIYQDFYNSLNPKQTIFEILSNPILHHQLCPTTQIKDKIVELLEKTGLDSSALSRYPHAFSGGQRQRINIARVLSLNPKLLICDEITSALDVQIQKQILDLLFRINKEDKISIMFISHDLAVIKEFCDFTLVMNQGKAVEFGPTTEVLQNPKDEYTKILIDSIPSLDPSKRYKVVNH